MLYLKFVNLKNNTEKRSVQVLRGLVIGRGATADIKLLDDETISRIHALVAPLSDGSLELRDLSSSTGTFITEKNRSRRLMPERGKGGAVKGRATLVVGDKFTVGKYRVEVCSEDVVGEVLWRRKLHEGLEKAHREAEKEITQVEFDVDD